MQISFCEWVGVAHHFCVSPYLAQGPSSPSRLWCLVSPRDSLLALLQLLLGGCPPVGSPPCLRVYNHNISTLKINIIKTYSYLYAVYSRNILVPEGLMSVCLCMGLGEGFESGCGWFWQAWNTYSLIEFGITTLSMVILHCGISPHYNRFQCEKMPHHFLAKQCAIYPHWSMRPLCGGGTWDLWRNYKVPWYRYRKVSLRIIWLRISRLDFSIFF